MRFRRVPVQKAQVSCRVPGQIAGEVPAGSGADSRQGSGRFRGRKLIRTSPAQMADEVPEGPVQIADTVPEGRQSC